MKSSNKDFNPKGRFAYTSVLHEGGFRLAIAEENEPGYWPTDYVFDSEADADTAALAMNDKLGLSVEDAALVIASSMRAQKRTKKKP